MEEIYNDKIILEIPGHELKSLCNAMKIVCNQIEEWEFETRLGITLEEAKAMLESLEAIYQKHQQLQLMN